MSFSLFDAFGNNAFSLDVVLAGGNPSFVSTEPGARYYSFTRSEEWSFLHKRYLESLAGIGSLTRNVGQGKPLP
jgi:hypothetical protein